MNKDFSFLFSYEDAPNTALIKPLKLFFWTKSSFFFMMKKRAFLDKTNYIQSGISQFLFQTKKGASI